MPHTHTGPMSISTPTRKGRYNFANIHTAAAAMCHLTHRNGPQPPPLQQHLTDSGGLSDDSSLHLIFFRAAASLLLLLPLLPRVRDTSPHPRLGHTLHDDAPPEPAHVHVHKHDVASRAPGQGRVFASRRTVFVRHGRGDGCPARLDQSYRGGFYRGEDECCRERDARARAQWSRRRWRHRCGGLLRLRLRLGRRRFDCVCGSGSSAFAFGGARAGAGVGVGVGVRAGVGVGTAASDGALDQALDGGRGFVAQFCGAAADGVDLGKVFPRRWGL